MNYETRNTYKIDKLIDAIFATFWRSGRLEPFRFMRRNSLLIMTIEEGYQKFHRLEPTGFVSIR